MPATKKASKTEAAIPEVDLKIAEPDAVDTTDTVDPSILEAHNKAIENLRLKCQEVKVGKHSLPSSRKLPKHLAKQMSDALGAEAGAVSGSKRIFDPNHPAVFQLNRLLDQVDAWKGSFTIVKSAGISDETDSEKANTKGLIVAGVRLIRIADIEEFDQGIMELRDEIKQAAELVQHCMTNKKEFEGQMWDAIIDRDKERLGAAFHEDDYPKDVTKVVGVDEPEYKDYHLNLSLPPAVLERQKRAMELDLNNTMETATEYLTTTLTKSFADLASKLLRKIRVHPQKSSPYAKYEDCEVKDLQKTAGGKVIVSLWVYPNATKDSKGSGEKLVLPPMAEEDYNKVLRPQSTDEKKTFRDTTVEGLMKKLNDFKRLKEMLGAPGEKIDNALEKIRDILSSAGDDSSKIAKEARNGDFFRAQLGKALESVNEELEEVAVTVKKARRNFNLAALAAGE